MNLRAAAAMGSAIVALTSCMSGGSSTSNAISPPLRDRSAPVAQGVFDPPLSSAERARESAVQARIDAKLAAGYVFQHTGTVSSIILRPDGTRTVYLGPGDTVTVALVPATKNRFDFHSARQTQNTLAPNATPVSPCDDSCNGGMPGSPTPAPRPTAPPNYSSCSAAGGATWYDEDSGLGGCLGVGASRGMSCGTWAYSSRGRGKLVMQDGTTYDDLAFISDNGFGTCHLGY